MEEVGTSHQGEAEEGNCHLEVEEVERIHSPYVEGVIPRHNPFPEQGQEEDPSMEEGQTTTYSRMITLVVAQEPHTRVPVVVEGQQLVEMPRVQRLSNNVSIYSKEGIESIPKEPQRPWLVEVVVAMDFPVHFQYVLLLVHIHLRLHHRQLPP